MSCAIVCHTFSLLLSRFVLAEHLTFRKKIDRKPDPFFVFQQCLKSQKTYQFSSSFPSDFFFCGQNSCTSCVIAKIIIYRPFIFITCIVLIRVFESYLFCTCMRRRLSKRALASLCFNTIRRQKKNMSVIE